MAELLSHEDPFEYLREQLLIDQEQWVEVMSGVDAPLHPCNLRSTFATRSRDVLILTYAEQLRMLASEEKVDLLDAVRHAGIPTSTYYRSIEGTMQLSQSKAEAIARAIKELAST